MEPLDSLAWHHAGRAESAKKGIYFSEWSEIEKTPVFVLYAIRYLLSATGKDETFRSERFGTKMSWKEHESLLGVFGSFVKKRKSACALCYNSYRTVPYWMEYILRMHTRCLHIVACCSHSNRSQCIMHITVWLEMNRAEPSLENYHDAPSSILKMPKSVGDHSI